MREDRKEIWSCWITFLYDTKIFNHKIEEDIKNKSEQMINLFPKDICKIIVSYSRDPIETFYYDNKEHKVTLLDTTEKSFLRENFLNTITVCWYTTKHKRSIKSCCGVICEDHGSGPYSVCCGNSKPTRYKTNKSIEIMSPICQYGKIYIPLGLL